MCQENGREQLPNECPQYLPPSFQTNTQQCVSRVSTAWELVPSDPKSRGERVLPTDVLGKTVGCNSYFTHCWQGKPNKNSLQGKTSLGSKFEDEIYQGGEAKGAKL